MKKIICLALSLWLCLGAAGLAQGLFPARQGQVTDLAGVLAEQTEKDFAALSEELENQTGYRLYLVTRHFLGGKEVSAYGRELFDAWNLKSTDALLLMVIGEESYTLTCGDKVSRALPAEILTALMGDHFRPGYLQRDYDRAAGNTALALGDALARAEGEKLNTKGLFGSAPAQKSNDWGQEISHFWQDLFGEEEEEEARREQEAQQEETKSNFRTLLTWGLVIYFLFIRKRIKKKRRR